MSRHNRPELAAGLAALIILAVVAVPVGAFLLLKPHNTTPTGQGGLTTGQTPGAQSTSPIPQLTKRPLVTLIPEQGAMPGGPTSPPLDKLEGPLVGDGLKLVVPTKQVKVSGDGVAAFGPIASEYAYQFAGSFLSASLSTANTMYVSKDLAWSDFALFANNMDDTGRARLQDLTRTHAKTLASYSELVTAGPFFWTDGKVPVPSKLIPPVDVVNYGTATLSVGPAAGGVPTLRILLPITVAYHYLDSSGHAWTYTVTKQVPLLLALPTKDYPAFRLHNWEAGQTTVSAPVRYPAFDQPRP